MIVHLGLLATILIAGGCSSTTQVEDKTTPKAATETAAVVTTPTATAAPAPTPVVPAVSADSTVAIDFCNRSLASLPGKLSADELKAVCTQVKHKPGCTSVAGEPIYHFDIDGVAPNAKRILVFANIHGDEDPSGALGRLWMIRLNMLNPKPRNFWRIVPVLNPDGLKAGTRTNKNGIDLNRNFPTKDWDELAVKSWKNLTRSNVRRFPGEKGGSEPEVHCAISQVEDYSPQLIISIHTPLAVLDFDGPKVPFPKFDYLPWKSLGTFPGSLGRYMWSERKIPVLTVELKDSLPEKPNLSDDLQDVIGELGVLVSR